jgi:predicted Zn-dependent protease with MMP-like domain
MAKDELSAIFERMPTWSAEMRQLAVDLLLWVENRDQDDDMDDLTEEDWADLDEGLAEAERGEFATEEEIQALFDRYRR